MTQLNDYQIETAMQRAMRLYEAQKILFSPTVSRLALSAMELPTAPGMRLRVNVWRNHAIETLLPLVTPYCNYRGWQPDFRLSGYDDSLTFADRQDSDADVLWLDSTRLPIQTSFAEWSRWLGMRIRVLRDASAAPIILLTWRESAEESETLQALADGIPAVFFGDTGAACADAGAPLLDLRSAIMAGTPVGKSAQLVLARKLGCHWLPAALLPAVKAIALDLDQTLHAGVLGEDGVEGVQLTPEHADFQRYVKSLQERGIFLALVSRNEMTDVAELFARRADYPLRLEDFSAVEVSWGDKAAAIERIAARLRIAPDSILFVDDNPGELANVAQQLPGIHTVLAQADAGLTRLAVHFYPGLWRWKTGSDDTKRIQDLKANSERVALAESAGTPEEYFRSLQVTLLYRHNPPEQLSRLADLCKKTNQFNLALRRFNEAEVAELMKRGDACVTSVQLTDRFSESGVIAVVIAERKDERLVVEELCVSCRALGRQLENTIVLLALREMPIFCGCREVAFRVQEGLRNKPALEWLARLLGCAEEPVSGLYELSAQLLTDFVPPEGVIVA